MRSKGKAHAASETYEHGCRCAPLDTDGTARHRMPVDPRAGATDTRRGRGVPARAGHADALARLQPTEPLRRLPRGAVSSGQPWLRVVAQDQVAVELRATRAPRCPHTEDP